MEPIIVCVRDLMFSSKILATARQLNVSVDSVRDPAALAGKSGQQLIIDLNQTGTIPAAQQWKAAGEGRTVIGFVSHVDTATIAEARAAGIDQVMARSQFVNVLPTLLQSAK